MWNLYIRAEWGTSVKLDRTLFYKLHTGTLLCLLLGISVVTVTRVQPVLAVLCVLSGVLSFLCYGQRNELRALLRFCLPVGAVLVLFNLLFNRNGMTVLFYVGDAAVTLESVLYAVFSALHFTGAVLWFSFYCAFLDADRVYRLFAGTSRGLAVIFSLSMALVPKTLQKYAQTRAALPVSGSKLTARFLRLSALFSWVLEDSFQTAVSMKARGAMLSVRRTRQKFRFSFADTAAVLFVIGIVCAVFLASPLKTEIYPRFRPMAYAETAWIYVPFTFFYFMPCIAKLWEVCKWKFSVQRI